MSLWFFELLPQVQAYLAGGRVSGDGGAARPGLT